MLLNGYEEKVEALTAELSLREKISMIHGAGLFRTGGVERLGIPPIKMSDGPMGVRFEFHNDNWGRVGHLDDGVTYCPGNSAIAATWNRKLAEKAGTVLGEEARGRGKDMILAPGINIMRTPLCGRNFEYFSEDPYLISELAVPLVTGIESADVSACVKHFALNNQETERNWVNVEIEERALREIYLPGFEAVVKRAKTKAVMGAYNLFREQHCCENKELLGGILRDEWGFDGVIVSDWGGVHNTNAAAESPLDIEMSIFNNFDDYCMAEPLIEAVEAGTIDEAYIDRKVKNILRFMLRIKMIDIVSEGADDDKKVYAVRNPERKKGSYNTAAHREIVLDTARESIVLLKNEGNRLPLVPETLHKLLVIGDNAAKIHSCGGGSAEIDALYEICPLLGIKMALGGNCEVTYTPGYYVPEQEEQEMNWQMDSLGEQELPYTPVPITGDSEEGRKKQEAWKKEALALAAEYDDIIFVGGLNHDIDKEGYDRNTMELPYYQDELIQELLKINPNMILVMMAGNPVDMTRWSSDAKAVVWTSYAGMETGTALAEVLFGAVNPSGKLPMTMPLSLEQTPAEVYGDFPGRELTEEEHARMSAKLTQTYREGVFVGYRYYDKFHAPVQFCFGHGLSYTTFEYGNILAEWEKTETDAQINHRILRVQIPITNTGKRAGKEVVQLYVGEHHVSPDNPVKELKGFQKVMLLPGETKTVEFLLTENDFSHFREDTGNWTVTTGAWKLYIGSSLVDIRSKADINV